MQTRIKQYGLWATLALTLLATFWVANEDESEDPQLEHTKSDLVVTKQLVNKENNAISSNKTKLAQREAIFETPNDLFTTLKTTSNLSIAENIEHIPINPFTYAGKFIDEDKITVYLIDGDKSHAVRTGNVIEELWQVKSIRPPTIVLKNLSTKTEIKIDIGVIS